MGSAFLDLTRDFGGAVIQAVMGVILAGVYAASLTKAFSSLPASEQSALSQQAAEQITSSYQGAVEVAASYPQAQAEQIVAAASQAFTQGKGAAIGVGLILTLIAIVVVTVLFPRKEAEEAYYETVRATDPAEA
jgi:hypothetical protein